MTASIPDNSTCVILAGKNRRQLKSLIAGTTIKMCCWCSLQTHDSRLQESSGRGLNLQKAHNLVGNQPESKRMYNVIVIEKNVQTRTEVKRYYCNRLL